MKVLGIVAEYDPLHIGHEWHIAESRKAVSPDAVYIALSPCFKQRGELSLLSPMDRAACAIDAGADAVFALPVLWTIRDAEHYALGAVALLTRLGITHLSFGAETPEPEKLKRIAGLLEESPDAYTSRLRNHLASGIGFPAAVSAAVDECIPEAAGILQHPNNILAVCYLRALIRLHSTVQPIVIRRKGSYHSSAINPSFPSAAGLRSALRRGIWQPALAAMPAYTAARIQRAFLDGHIPDDSALDMSLLHLLNTVDLSAMPDMTEGLDSAIRKAARLTRSRAELVEALTGRRYPAARIRRICAYALLGVTRDRLLSLSLPDRTLLLALRKKKEVTSMWRDLPVQIDSSFSRWQQSADPEDVAAWQLWTGACHLSSAQPFTRMLYTGE